MSEISFGRMKMDSIDAIPTLREVTDAGNELISVVSCHPALIDSEVKKKPHRFEDDSSEATPMDTDYGDQLDQIELANKRVADIDDKIRNIYKSVRQKYSTRFPELRLPDPMQYIITIQILGNRPQKVSDEKIKSQLSEVLEPKMHLLVTMSASTTQGVKIEPEEMDRILLACNVAIHLANLRTKLLSFVERNMTTIAPNLSVILGAPIAAKIMGLAGGLMNLALKPSCDIPSLGSHKSLNIETDFNAPPRVGHIYECDLIQQIPFDHTKDVRKRAVKWVANKCILAARCDLSKTDQNGNAGKKLRQEIEAKINKELEPPPKKAPRPLPAPIEKSGKKRGGKRVRRMKERYANTELRKAVNRVNFGDVGDDAYQDDLGFARSQLNAIQKLRGPQINDKTRIRLSKSAQKKLAKSQMSASTSKDDGNSAPTNASVYSHDAPSMSLQSTINGAVPALLKPENNVKEETASITVKPEQQELKIYNPKAKESFTTNETSDYFSSTAGFFAIKREDAN